MSRIGNKDGSFPRPLTSEDLQEAQEGEGQGQTGALGKPELPKKVSALDAERMVSQAGFARAGGKRRTDGFALGDGAQGPIPLPDDDVDATAFATELLASAQDKLLQHNAQLGRVRSSKRRQPGLLGAIVALLEGDEDAAEGEEQGAEQAEQTAALLAMAEETPPDPARMAAVADSVRLLLGVDFNGAPPAAALMATSLLVAGAQDEVVAEAGAAGGLQAEPLLGGVQRVIEDGRRAADDARKRVEGVQRNIALQRTFVPKR